MKAPNKISPGEITAPSVYFNRRNFVRAGILAVSGLGTGALYRSLNPSGSGEVDTPVIQGLTMPGLTKGDASGLRATDSQTSLENITHYNNFYEFSTDKVQVAPASASFNTTGWRVSVEGLVKKPRV